MHHAAAAATLRRCLWLLAGLGLAAGHAWGADPPAKTREELFLEVFKHPPPDLPVSAYLVVVVDGGARQKVKAVLTRGERELQLEGRAVTLMLARTLRPELLRQLERRVDGDGWLARAAIEEAGVATSFDPRRFEFAITTPPQLRETSIVDIGGAAVDPATVDALQPAPVSAFLNYSLKDSHRALAIGDTTVRQHVLGLSLDGAMNVGRLVLEGSAFGQAGSAARSFQRGDVRLVLDQPQRALRYSAGDLRYPVVGYQTVVEMGGIGVSRDFSLQPHLRSYQSGQFQFYLERPAEVKVWVNESLVSTLQLPAGSHDIRGLAPAIGLNNTRLVIEDSAGRRETLDFSFLYSPLLLEPGRSMFSYNAGFRRSTESDGSYRYDSGRPVLSASYLQGVSGETTLGAYLQAEPSRALAGLQAIHAFGSNTVQVDAAAARLPDAPWDVAAKVDWLRLPSERGPGLQSQLSLEYLGRNFGTLNDTVPARRNRVNLYASASLPVAGGHTARLSGSYSPARDPGRADAYSLVASLTRRWGRFTTTTMALRTRRSSLGEVDTGIAFGITFSFGNGTSNIYAAREIEGGASTVAWNSVRASNAATPYGFASARFAPGSREYVGGGGYWGHQGLAEASQTRTEVDRFGGHSSSDETALRLQGALVFADGAFGVARTVSENFAIVRGKAGLAGVAMKVDPDSQGGSRARSSWLGPAVVGDIASYQLRDLRVEPVDPPIGASPEKLSYSLAPAYKSGFLLELGKEQKMVAVGRLVDGQRQPLAHQTIEIRRVGADGAKPWVTFTSRGGGFQLPDVTPGRYELRPAAPAPWESVILDIPQAPDGLFRLGDVQVPAR